MSDKKNDIFHIVTTAFLVFAMICMTFHTYRENEINLFHKDLKIFSNNLHIFLSGQKPYPERIDLQELLVADVVPARLLAPDAVMLRSPWGKIEVMLTDKNGEKHNAVKIVFDSLDKKACRELLGHYHRYGGDVVMIENSETFLLTDTPQQRRAKFLKWTDSNIYDRKDMRLTVIENIDI